MKLKFKNQDGIKYSIKFKKPDARKHGQCAGFCYYPHNGKADIVCVVSFNPHGGVLLASLRSVPCSD